MSESAAGGPPYECPCGATFETLSSRRLHEADECPLGEHDRELFRQPCCCCDQRLMDGGSHINWTLIAKKAEWDYPAAGNVAFDIPDDYAMALVCDECVAAEAEIKWVLKGEDLERVDPDDLEDLPTMHERILASFPEDDVDEAHASLWALISGLNGEWVPKAEAARYVAADVGYPQDEGAFIIDRLVDEERLVEDDTADQARIGLVDD